MGIRHLHAPALRRLPPRSAQHDVRLHKSTYLLAMEALKRRAALTYVAGVATCLGGVTPAAGQEPKPKFTKIALLPPTESFPEGLIAPFNTTLLAEAKPPSLVRRLFISPRRIADQAADEERRKELAARLAALSVNASEMVVQSVLQAAKTREINVIAIDSKPIAEALREQVDFKVIPPDIDGILDINILSAGYYSSDRASGYTPAIYLNSKLWSVALKGKAVQYYDYNADFRDAKGDPRFFTASPTLIVKSPDEFSARAGELREGVRLLVSRLTEALIADVATMTVKG